MMKRNVHHTFSVQKLNCKNFDYSIWGINQYLKTPNMEIDFMIVAAANLHT